MTIAARFPIVALLMTLATACTSVQQADSSVQLPGETATRAGLQVPPDAWARPTVQTASAIPTR